nr:hypothetical protein [Acholeplasmatales bacterium]
SGEQSGISINECDGYGEAAYLLFDAQSGEQYDAYYKKTSDSSYTKIDPELVRVNGTNGRVDVVGLSAGEYQIKVENRTNNSIYAISDSFNVYAQDRSGYAHFNNTDGVGAYKNDGTLKDNVVIVYVNETNKNTVTAKIGSSTYTGISDIIKHATNSNYPVDIRILGTVGAATWSKSSPSVSKYSAATTSTVKGLNGQYLELKNYSESDLIDGGYNELDESTYSKLNGLVNKIKYDSSKKEFDSYYNMLDVSGAKNVTVEGIGADAEISQWGFTWKSSNSIEIKNITFDAYTEDACGIEGSGSDSSLTSLSSFTSKNYWIHNNTFNKGVNYWDVCSEQDKHDGDGATDLKRCAYVTLSYNEYYNNHKTGLVGGGDSQITGAVTFHHNYYNQCQSRLPFARQANMHMYNNYYYRSTGNNMQIYAGAYAFIENCYFEGVSKTFTVSNEYFKTNDTSIQSGKKYYTKSNSNYLEASYEVGTSISGQKIDDVDIYEKKTPAVKSFNNIFSNCGNYSGATIVESRTQQVTNGNLFDSSFDTNSGIFYYDSVNEKSRVSIMNTAEETKLLVPVYAGAGKMKVLIGNEQPVEPGEDPQDATYTTVLDETFDVDKTAIKTDSIPSSSGLYYNISDPNIESSTSANADSGNYVSISNNKLNINDTSDATATFGYYMFNETYTSGKIKYSVTFTPTKQAGSWSPVSFIGLENSSISLRSNKEKILGCSITSDSITALSSAAYSANTVYTVVLTADYDNNIVKFALGDTEIIVSGITPFEVLGVKFMTAKTATDRSFTVSEIKIETLDK